MSGGTEPSIGQFVGADLPVGRPPGCPEIRLHLAAGLHRAWQRAEEAMAPAHVPTPYWAMAWVGGQALARYVLDTPAVVRGRRVLDVGSGSGLCAIAAAKAGAVRVVANDIDCHGLGAVRTNAALNGVFVETSLGDATAARPGGFDVLLAGDLWYDRRVARRMTPWLRAMAADGAEVLIGDRRRAFFPKAGIEPLASYDIETSTEVEPAVLTRAGVWRLGPVP